MAQMKKPKWAKKLTIKDLKHIAETSSSGAPTLRAFKANHEHQKAQGIVCHECNFIASKLGL